MNSLHGDSIIVKIMKELSALRDTSKMSSEQVLMWTQTKEATNNEFSDVF